MLELCKTRTKKSSPDMFNCYVAMTGHDKVTDAGKATTCRCKINAPSLSKKYKKMKDIPKTLVLTGNQVKDFRQEKEQDHCFRPFKRTQSISKTLKTSIEQGLRKQ